MKRLALMALAILIALPGCGSKAESEDKRTVEDWRHDVKPLADAFQDTVNVADATGRLGLPPVIQEMQRIRRDMLAIDCPPEAEAARDAYAAAMQNTIDLFLEFMQTDIGEDLPPERIDEFKAAWDLVTVEFAAIGITPEPEEAE